MRWSSQSMRPSKFPGTIVGLDRFVTWFASTLKIRKDQMFLMWSRSDGGDILEINVNSSAKTSIDIPFDWDPMGHITTTVNDAIYKKHAEHFVKARCKVRGTWFEPWLTANPAVVAHKIVLDKALPLKTAVINALSAAEKLDLPEVLIELPYVRRAAAGNFAKALFISVMSDFDTHKRVLDWWVPPVSNSAKATCHVCLGQPDIMYLMHGLQDGFDKITFKFDVKVIVEEPPAIPGVLTVTATAVLPSFLDYIALDLKV